MDLKMSKRVFKPTTTLLYNHAENTHHDVCLSNDFLDPLQKKNPAVFL